MSASGTKRTSLFAPHRSAIGGKADIDPTARLTNLAKGGPVRHGDHGDRERGW
jgi:hypothetical protein